MVSSTEHTKKDEKKETGRHCTHKKVDDDINIRWDDYISSQMNISVFLVKFEAKIVKIFVYDFIV